MSTGKTCYIVGCITDGGRITGDGHIKKFEQAEDVVRALGFQPVNPVTLDHNHPRRWQDYMQVTLHAMLDCDAMYALPCWQRSKGATIEVQLALRLNKNVIYAEVEQGQSGIL